jgi:hypothetical protein
MRKLRTRLRAWLLRTWEPPAGVRARVAYRIRDGMILVALEAGGVLGGVMIPPKSPVWFNPSVFHALDYMAARMLDVAAARSGAGDLRIAAVMEVAGEAFADGIERAARPPIETTVSEEDR